MGSHLYVAVSNSKDSFNGSWSMWNDVACFFSFWSKFLVPLLLECNNCIVHIFFFIEIDTYLIVIDATHLFSAPLQNSSPQYGRINHLLTDKVASLPNSISSNLIYDRSGWKKKVTTSLSHKEITSFIWLFDSISIDCGHYLCVAKMLDVNTGLSRCSPGVPCSPYPPTNRQDDLWLCIHLWK